MDCPLSQPFPQPGSLPGGVEAFPGNPSCSSHEETTHPALPKFHLKPICKQPEKPLESTRNRFLSLAAAPDCLLPRFSHFSRSDFSLKSGFSYSALPLHQQGGKEFPGANLEQHSRRSPSLPKIPVSLGKRLLLEFSSRSVFLLYPCAHPLPEAREGNWRQFPGF